MVYHNGKGKIINAQKRTFTGAQKHRKIEIWDRIILFIRNRDPHGENVENILAIYLPLMKMQHIREYPSASHVMRKSAWNDGNLNC